MNRAILIALGLLATSAAALTPEQQRGREIFFIGQSPAGPPIEAVPGRQREPVSARLLPCASCHGEAGRGRPEGGAQPADITPRVLRSEAVVGTRARPPYSRALLERAIRRGLDSAGNPLDRLMPRYRMGVQQANDLIAYLDLLGSDPPVGVSADAIRVNVIGAPRLAAPPQTVYGRRIELHHGRNADAFLTLDASADGSASVAAAERDGMPTIAFHAGRADPGPHAFVITASMDDQISALQNHARRRDLAWRLFTDDCIGLDRLPGSALALMTSAAAANCPLGSISLALDRRVIVAAPSPPTASGDDATAQAELSIATALLAQLGREPGRRALLAALVHLRNFEAPGFQPVTWSTRRRFGTRSVWLMTLDLREQRLLGQPGWSVAE
jgi:hypothetical protein